MIFILQVVELPSIDLVRVVGGRTQSASVDISSGELGNIIYRCPRRMLSYIIYMHISLVRRLRLGSCVGTVGNANGRLMFIFF